MSTPENHNSTHDHDDIPEELKAVDDLYARIPKVTAPADMEERVMTAIRQKRHEPRRVVPFMRVAVPALAAAAAIAIVVSGFLLPATTPDEQIDMARSGEPAETLPEAATVTEKSAPTIQESEPPMDPSLRTPQTQALEEDAAEEPPQAMAPESQAPAPEPSASPPLPEAESRRELAEVARSRDLAAGQRDAAQDASTAQAAARAFNLQNNTWVQQGYESQPTTPIARDGDGLRLLVPSARARQELLALDRPAIFEAGGEWYRLEAPNQESR